LRLKKKGPSSKSSREKSGNTARPVLPLSPKSRRVGPPLGSQGIFGGEDSTSTGEGPGVPLASQTPYFGLGVSPVLFFRPSSKTELGSSNLNPGSLESFNTRVTWRFFFTVPPSLLPKGPERRPPPRDRGRRIEVGKVNLHFLSGKHKYPGGKENLKRIVEKKRPDRKDFLQSGAVFQGENFLTENRGGRVSTRKSEKNSLGSLWGKNSHEMTRTT